MTETKDGFTLNTITMTERDARYVMLKQAICDYFDALRDKDSGREYAVKEAKKFILETCLRVVKGI